MQSAFVFLIDTLFSLLFWVFLLRLLLQWNRSNLRNPVVGAVMQLTNWLVPIATTCAVINAAI